MKHILLFIIVGGLLSLLVPSVFAETFVKQEVPAVAKIAVKDVLIPAAPGSVHLDGRLGAKLDLCVTNRLLAQNVEDLIIPFRAKTETNWWDSEFWGKWFTSLTLADAYQSTPATRSIRDEAVKELIATAAPDGYIGTHAPE